MCVRKLLCFFIVLSPLLDYSSSSMFCSVIFLRIWLILCTLSCVRIWICPIVSLGQWKTCTHLYFHKGYLLEWPFKIHHNFIAILRAIVIFFSFLHANFSLYATDVTAKGKLYFFKIIKINKIYFLIHFQILESQDSIIADETYNDTAILSEYKIPVGQPERRKMCCWLYCIFPLYLSAPFSIFWHHVNDVSFFKNINAFLQFINIYYSFLNLFAFLCQIICMFKKYTF